MSTTIVPADKSQLTREEINRKQKEYIFPSVSTYYSDPLPMDHASCSMCGMSRAKNISIFSAAL